MPKKITIKNWKEAKTMKATGIVRMVDELGRIILPKELRKTHGLEESTPMEILTEGNTIILRKYEPTCVFCNGTDGVHIFKGHKVCWNCRKELGNAKEKNAANT